MVFVIMLLMAGMKVIVATHYVMPPGTARSAMPSFITRSDASE